MSGINDDEIEALAVQGRREWVKLLADALRDGNPPVTVIRTFTDDHILGCVCEIGGAQVGFWWCGWEIVAALTYAHDSATARAVAREYVEDALKDEEQGFDVP